MKNKPFLGKWGSRLYIGTVILVFPYWIAEMYLNFQYFNSLGNEHFTRLRPWEALARDPWWIFTTCNLIYVIKRDYNLSLVELVRASPRFGLLMISMVISIIFILADTVVSAAHLGSNSGINPYWKLAAVFKCAADALFLDDFKKVLETLINTSLKTMGVQDPVMSGGPPPPTESQARDFGLNHISSNHSHGRKHSMSPFSRRFGGSGSDGLPQKARRHTISNGRLHLPHFTFPRNSSSEDSNSTSGKPTYNGHGHLGLPSHRRGDSANHSPKRSKEWWDHKEEEISRELRAVEEGPRPSGLTAAPTSHRLPIQSNGIPDRRLTPIDGDRASVASREVEIEFLTSAV
ncbi:MAG: hypothetical protein M1814_002060 [Vezdaea aestivalis]|nr:MAG: hypothetical protein M1814_002060 [Vezdaea aestivalis]